jgi:hypothetical protein
VYGFPRGISEGWAGRRDGLFAGKFRGDPDPKEGFHPMNCKSKRDKRVLEFLLPILNPDKPKRISLTMANTLFGAMSGIWPVNWGILIHEVVARALPHIGRKPSFLTPFVLHLYQHYELFLPDEEDLMTIAANEMAYKLVPEAVDTETSSDPIVPEAAPSSPGSPPPLPLLLIRKPDPAGRPRGETWISPLGTFRKIPSGGSKRGWRNCNTSTPGWNIVVRIFTWVPIKKNTQGRPNECQIVYLGITIKLIDRSQRDYNEIRTTFLNELAFKGFYILFNEDEGSLTAIHAFVRSLSLL